MSSAVAAGMRNGERGPVLPFWFFFPVCLGRRGRVCVGDERRMEFRFGEAWVVRVVVGLGWCGFCGGGFFWLLWFVVWFRFVGVGWDAVVGLGWGGWGVFVGRKF